ncbi:MAG: peptide-methionine (S)-S-oxide reductase MsrA [Solobacterium sp.]|nr:peptide-methionine (S)-S-oxide reductase MsrA [Solobacterium sp.]
MKVIYLAGGCFWGSEKAFRLLNGVHRTTVGYANGRTDHPTYEEVCTDTTGHRETVKVEYDPDEVSLETILKAFFLIIDPTKENRQGNDIGTQYQTGIYTEDPESEAFAEAYVKEKRKLYPVFFTEVKPLECFWPAEEYHQNYLEKNPQGYCHIPFAEFELVKGLNRKGESDD